MTLASHSEPKAQAAVKKKFGGRFETLMENIAVRCSRAGIGSRLNAYRRARTNAGCNIEKNTVIKGDERLGHRDGKSQLDG